MFAKKSSAASDFVQHSSKLPSVKQPKHYPTAMPITRQSISTWFVHLHAKSETHISQRGFEYLSYYGFAAILLVSFVWGYHAELAIDATEGVEPSILISVGRGFGRALTVALSTSILLISKMFIIKSQDILPSELSSTRVFFPIFHVRMSCIVAVLCTIHVAISVFDFYVLRNGDASRYNSTIFGGVGGVVPSGWVTVFLFIITYVFGVMAKNRKRQPSHIKRTFHTVTAAALVIAISLHGSEAGAPFAYKILLPVIGILILDHLYRATKVRWKKVKVNLDEDIDVFDSVVRIRLTLPKPIFFHPGHFFSKFPISRLYYYSPPQLLRTTSNTKYHL